MVMGNQQTNCAVFPRWVKHMWIVEKALYRLVAVANNVQAFTFLLFKRSAFLQPANWHQ